MGVIAPWCLGVGLLVSITADAGQDPTIGGSLAAMSAHAARQPDDLVPMRAVALIADGGGFGLDVGQRAGTGERLLMPLSFDLGTPDDYRHVTDEVEPRRDLKRDAPRGVLPVSSVSRSFACSQAVSEIAL